MSPRLAQLRAALSRFEQGSDAPLALLPFGLGPVDSVLAAGGLRIDSLHEVAGNEVRPGDEAAAMLFAAGIAARTQGPALWIERRRDLFAPGLAQAGLSPERLIHAWAADDQEALALAEEGLRHRSLGAVVAEVAAAGLTATRRLQLAAEGGRTLLLLLRPWKRADRDPLAEPSAAATRWRIAALPSLAPPGLEGVAGLGRPRWQVVLARQRGGPPGAWIMEACDATGRCALASGLADRTAAEVGADRRAA